MANRPALFTQADIRRIIAAAKDAGAAAVEIPMPNGSVIVRLTETPEATETPKHIDL
jgi:hypothetical protein